MLNYLLDVAVPLAVTITVVASALLMISIDRDLKKFKRKFDR